ncbi:arabinan endo-1,5-alpha-L-arabinosidase A [Beauveria brongniartii RCEF 3172]|uniref:Arabinan endo-1,5-alpha-L-arabinosidase A n=1 Tax=Beauveria brongniartii RCEF 3172 TaxID=1081107 RepID=A0A162HU76_9HYPO|nr:arabinan endo-1,5-alpha-L-arabinosidase A [Beauveria brongniartii RCEF 3172]
MGFVLRASEVGVGANNYRGYYVGIDRAGAGGVVIDRADKAWQQLRFVPAAISDLATLKVQMTGDLLTVYLNNMSRPLTTLHDATYRQGQVVLRTYRKAASIGALVVAPLLLLVGKGDGGDDGGSGKAIMNTTFSDLILEAEMLLTKDGPGTAGVLFRASSLGRGLNAYKGYYVGLASDGTLVLGRGDGETWTEIQSVKVEVKVYHTYRIKVQAVGSSIDVYFVDMAKAVMVTTDSSFGSGMVGARLKNSAAIFHSFAIRRK